jgi:hypothetical protein
MKDRELEKMELDGPGISTRIVSILDRRQQTERRKVQNQLDELGRKFAGDPGDFQPKFRNPDNPSGTWARDGSGTHAGR